jgi:hypothetical protein
MNSYKITWYKGFYLDPFMTGDNIIKAKTEDEAIDIFNREYLSKGRHWDSVVNCSSLEYQLAHDSEMFDSNGRRRF